MEKSIRWKKNSELEINETKNALHTLVESVEKPAHVLFRILGRIFNAVI